MTTDPPAPAIGTARATLRRAACAWALAAAAQAGAATVRAELVEEISTPTNVDSGAPAPVPVFDAAGRLRWQSLPPSPAPADCTANAPPEVVLGTPRVLLWRCAERPARRLTGGGADGAAWVRALEHPSGRFRIDVFVGSARADALTLNTLEILDPASGATVVAPPLRSVDSPPRSVPVFGVNGPVTCAGGGAPCYAFSAEGTPAGLLQLARDGASSVLERPRSAWFAPIVASDLQLGAEGRLLYLAETWLFRGTAWVRFAIFDLERGERAYAHRHGENHVVSEPRVILGPGGHVAFAYRDATSARHVAVHYLVRR